MLKNKYSFDYKITIFVLTKKLLKMSDKKKENCNIMIRHVAPDVHADIKMVAKNTGVTLSALLKPHLRIIRDSYPEYLRLPEKGIK